MPKKTKRNKQLADLHRRKAVQKTPSLDFVKTQFQETEKKASAFPAATYSWNKQSSLKPRTVELRTDYSYIKRDLIKITIFTFFAFTIQVVLYFVLQRG